MKYLPLVNLNPQDVSSALWNISRPDSDTNQTKLYCSWITHPETGQHALSFIEDDTQPVHPDSDTNIDNLCNMISFLITDEEKELLSNILKESKGGRVNVVSVLPVLFQNALISEEQAILDGWFPELLEFEDVSF